ncbi:MAG: metalloregulator ArsR/SmtB family transcription factor [Eubacterium sp.]|nr:metalloregulator ArsR/SmtB family transcription factor [Eubacterium sp.]
MNNESEMINDETENINEQTEKINKETDKRRKCSLPDEDEMFDLAELFKIFGDSTRIRILFVLFDSERSVGEIAEILNMTQSAVSHQLKILRQSKLVGARREGKQIFYFLADEHVHTIIRVGREHIEE